MTRDLINSLLTLCKHTEQDERTKEMTFVELSIKLMFFSSTFVDKHGTKI